MEIEIDSKSILKKNWDSNVITPGTTFMEKVSQVILDYIANNLKNNRKWKDLKIIFSDSSIPKEGEHKILDFIRQQWVNPSYDPNTSHCIYGADADLIMLSLSTHEPHFYVIRESIETDFKKRG